MKLKMKICTHCNTMKYIWKKGKCKLCAMETEGVKHSTKKEPKIRKINYELDSFFSEKIDLLSSTKRSEESGLRISYPSKFNVCHILDKSRHKSVATHPSNYIFLTIDEHSRFDKLLFEHRFEDLEKEFQRAWPIVLKRLPEFIYECRENTKLKTALEKLI